MKRIVAAVTASIWLVSAGFALAQPATAYTGDAVLVTIPGTNLKIASATFGGQPASVFFYKGSYRSVAGVPLAKAPGVYNLRVKFAGRPDFVKPIAVKRKKFPIVELPVPEKLNQTPRQLVSNLQASNAAAQKQFEFRTPEIYFSDSFGLALADNRRVVSPFGEIRKTGEETIRHLGVDFGAATGTPVGAINAGVVKKSYFDPIYGNSVIVDHGQGIYSFYLHLNERKVSDGDKVGKGGFIGAVGQTGYATAPHLHLTVRINNVSVDPVQFVRAFAILK